MKVENIRILIADDHALFREGLKALFSATEGIDIAGEAATGEETIILSVETKPDVVLMDINMPGKSGIQAAREILNSDPEIGVIMVTMIEEDAALFAAMRAGARGYVLKGAHHRELLQTVRAVASGQVLFGPSTANRIMGFFQDFDVDRKPSLPEESFPELTPRELDVLDLIAQGANNSQIAEVLVITEKTVRNHITSIFNKLQVIDRSQAIIKARDAGLGDNFA